MPWGEAEAIAQIVAAGGTLTLAGLTWRLARQTRSLSDRTHELAEKAGDQVAVAGSQVKVAAEQVEAARQEAKATEALALEARTDRQLLWRPQLERRSFRIHTVVGGDRKSHDLLEVLIRNAGAGPALSVVVVARRMENVGHWWLIRLGNLRPGETAGSNLERGAQGAGLTQLFDGFSDCGLRQVVTFLMLCTDVLGRRFRFGISEPGNPYEGEMPFRALNAEVSDGPEHVAGWAVHPIVWG